MQCREEYPTGDVGRGNCRLAPKATTLGLPSVIRLGAYDVLGIVYAILAPSPSFFAGAVHDGLSKCAITLSNT
jgi:hypothetical protein